MSDWPHTINELGEFFLVLIFCVFPAVFLIMNMNGIIYGVFH